MEWFQVLVCISLSLIVFGGSPYQASSAEEDPSSTQYYYRVDSPSMEMSKAELRFDATNRGQFIFRRKNDEEDIQLDLQLLPETVQRLNRYIQDARFLTSDENYQGDRNLSHLNTMTFRYRQGIHQREVSFNYTRNPAMRALTQLLQQIVTQESRIFNIQIARQHEPLDLDRQLQALKREVKNGWVGEPAKLRPLLEDLQADEGVLLIARRRAREILGLIKDH